MGSLQPMQSRRLGLATLAVNSSLGFALGTVIALGVYQVGLIAAGLLFDREPVWFPDRVEFLAAGSDAAWSGGMVLVLLAGWALAGIYRGGTRYDGTQLAVLWVTLHLFREGSLALIVVPFSGDSHAAVALAASNLPSSLNWVVAVLGAAGLLGIGLLAAPALLRFARSKQDLASRKARLAFLAILGIVAWAAGALLTLPLLIPDGPAEALWLLPWSGVFLLFTLAASPEPREIDPVRTPVRFAWRVLLLLGVLIGAARMFLAGGWTVAW